MSDKKVLLEQAAVRRFMELAGPGVLNAYESVSDRFYKADETAPKTVVTEAEVPPAPPGEEEMPEEPALDGEEPDGDETPGSPEQMVAELVAAIADAIEAKTGVKVDVEQGAGGEEELEVGPEEEPEKVEPGAEKQEAPIEGETPDMGSPSSMSLSEEEFNRVVSTVTEKLIELLTGMKEQASAAAPPTAAPVTEAPKAVGKPGVPPVAAVKK